MKKLLTIALLTIFSWGFGQALTLNELIQRLDSPTTNRKVLEERKWQFLSDDPARDGKLGEMIFVSNEMDLEMMNFKTILFVHNYSTSRDRKGNIQLYFNNADQFGEYLTNITKKKNTKEIHNVGSDDEDYQIFQDGKLTYIFNLKNKPISIVSTNFNYFLTITTNKEFAESALRKMIKDE